MNPSTRYSFKGGYDYPLITITWTPSQLAAGGGYEGVLTLWHASDDKDPRTHEVSVGQSMPLGSLHVQFDGFSHGAWAFAGFEGVGVTERDLQWATLWAALALRSRRAAMDDLRPIKL